MDKLWTEDELQDWKSLTKNFKPDRDRSSRWWQRVGYVFLILCVAGVMLVGGYVWGSSPGSNGSPETAVAAEITQTPTEEVMEEVTPAPAVIPVPNGEPQQGGVLLLDEPQPCASGTEVWYRLTIVNSGEEAAAFNLQLPDTAQLFRPFGGGCPRPDQELHSIDGDQQHSLQTEQSLALALRMPAPVGDGLTVGLFLGQEEKARQALASWSGDAIPAPRLTLVDPPLQGYYVQPPFGEVIIPIAATIHLPGSYLLVCRPESEAEEEHIVSTPLWITADNAGRALTVNCRIPVGQHTSWVVELSQPDSETGEWSPIEMAEALRLVLAEAGQALSVERLDYYGMSWQEDGGDVGLALDYVITFEGKMATEELELEIQPEQLVRNVQYVSILPPDTPLEGFQSITATPELLSIQFTNVSTPTNALKIVSAPISITLSDDTVTCNGQRCNLRLLVGLETAYMTSIGGGTGGAACQVTEENPKACDVIFRLTFSVSDNTFSVQETINSPPRETIQFTP